jgi:eukaryotic-like serine/threonine-protein kinase
MTDGEAPMDTERNLLFGVVALQSGAVDADRLAETCADWVSKPAQELADLFVDRGLVTDEQKTAIEQVVARELESHGGDSQATLAATMDGRSLEAIRGVGGENGSLEAKLSLPPPEPDGHVMLRKLSPGDSESRERYTLTHLHAKGGMGRVWLARDTALGRQIALKELRPDQSDNSIVWSRFLYEAKITAQLEHPGIVPVYEVREGEAPYYTMRFVRGRTLSEATRAYHKKRAAGEADPLGLVELLNAFVGVCQAVAYAHSRGIIHRDLKGQNVVLGEFGEVMVLDWGLAKRIAPDQQAEGPAQQAAGTMPVVANPPTGPTLIASTQDEDSAVPEARDGSPGPVSRSSSDPGSNGHAHHQASPTSGPGHRPSRESGAGPDGTMQGQLLGTPAYMAPEQAQGRHNLVDERTDVYGLGAILYEVLTGRPPFIAPKTVEILRKVCKEPPIPPRQIVPAVSPGLEAVCLKALRKAKDERYPSALLLAQDVQRWLADEPVRAYDEPWVSRALRWARRHKTLVSTAASLLVTATITLAVSTVLVSSERNEAEAQGQQARQAVNLLTQVKDIGFEDQLDPKQEEFLQHALAYYEQFTGRAARDPAVRLEHGLAYQQMGDIQRKLGKPTKSEQAYRKATEILEPMATAAQAGPEPKRALAQTRTLLGNLLVHLSGDQDQIEALYRQAIETQQTLASAPAATTEDRLHLGQTLKSQADLLRFHGQFTRAKSVYDKALAVLKPARAADAKNHEVRNELALAIDARGLVYRELGQIKPAEQDFRRALELLNALVADFPTVSRYRESLAKAYNDLGVLEQDTGDLAAAETNLRRELPLVERLAQDFPARPEHSRQRARTLYNLGRVLLAQDRLVEAEPILRRAVEVNGAIATQYPDDLQIRFDLAKCHHNLGEFLLEKGDAKRAITSFLKASEINEGLVKASPGFPRYRSLQATSLTSLGLALEQVKQPKVEETYRAALAIYEKLVTDYPDNVEYRIGQARCVRNLGPIMAEAGQAEQAEILYQRALTFLDAKDKDQGAGAQMQERMRSQAALLNNLGNLRRPGAEDAFRRSIAASESLVTQKPAANTDYHILAIAQFNLGDLLVDLKRLPDAAPWFAQSVANFETLVAAVPKSVEFQSEFGQVLEKQANFLAQSDKAAEAKTALVSAVAHQRQAVRLSKNRDDERRLLGSHLLELAKINLKLGAYQEASGDALELPNTVPASDRGQGCLDAARILARLVTKVGGDGQLAQLERDQLAKNYFGRTIVLLREAIDTNPKLSEQTKADSDIKALESRPEFQTIMNTLVIDVGR